MTHPSVSRLEPAAFPNELGLTKQRLESKLGVPVDHFAYPFGNRQTAVSQPKNS